MRILEIEECEAKGFLVCFLRKNLKTSELCSEAERGSGGKVGPAQSGVMESDSTESKTRGIGKSRYAMA